MSTPLSTQEVNQWSVDNTRKIADLQSRLENPRLAEPFRTLTGNDLEAAEREARFLATIAEREREIAALKSNQPGFERFGRAIRQWCCEHNEEFFGNEISEEIMPLAVEAGVAERTIYDPAKHGPHSILEEGDEHWRFFPSVPVTPAPSRAGRALEAAKAQGYISLVCIDGEWRFSQSDNARQLEWDPDMNCFLFIKSAHTLTTIAFALSEGATFPELGAWEGNDG